MTTVLLVDDQFELRAIHGTYLQEHGYRVVTAGDGNRALERARADAPDVIVLDHSLPGRTGVEVARELSRDPQTAGIPIVMMTAHSYGAVGQKARAAGCVAFLSKPCSPSRVLQEVMRQTRRGGAAAAAPAQVQ
jgi:two-component system, cell cycle response regulator DivK